jgi:cobalt-zinc-cadmium efflux system membrane fusion protein
MRTPLPWLLGALLLGCQPERSEPTAPPPPAQASAVADDALCKEHGVLEAVCTKCNPALVAVFRAKGDFCEEHGFPESICPICHPERAGKPSVDVSAPPDDGAPADGTKIRFKTKQTGARAGIETVEARSEPGGARVTAVAKLVYDATKVAQINARAAGVVKAIKVDVGSMVKRGAALAVIESADVGADRSRLAAARARAAAAQENLARQLGLQQEGITSRKSLLQAEQEAADAKSELGALSASLAVLGAAPDQAGGAGYTLSAPIAGVVTQRAATVGRLVSTDEVLFEIVDTSSIWAELEVNERDLSSLRLGQQVELAFDGATSQDLHGSIAYLSPSIDPHTRTALVRVPLANPSGQLRANMYGEGTVSLGDARTSVIVPRSAIQRAKDVSLVFVRIQDDQYETRRVEIGESLDDQVEIVKGVKMGEQVVTTGSFLLKTETLKDSIGAGCCEVD